MKSTLSRLQGCRMKISVEVEPDSVEQRYQEVLKQIQRAANLPGFRQGNAPLDLVEKRFAREVEDETVKVIVPEAYHRACAKEKASPVSLPSITDVKFERGKKLTFLAEFDAAPDFSLKNYKGIKVKRPSIEVTADDVRKAIDSLLESRAELVPIVEPRAVRQGDFILSDIEIWENDKYVPGRKGVLLYAEPGGTDDFCEKVVGANVGEVREITADLPAEDKAKGLVGRRPAYRVWVRGVREKRVPELDEAFAKAFGQESVEALRDAVRKDLGRHKASESQRAMRDQIYDHLLKSVKFDVPQTLVDKQKQRLLEQARREAHQAGIDAKRLEMEMARLEEEARRRGLEQVRLYFILQRVAAAESIDADEEELEQRLQAIVLESKRPLEEVRRVFEEDLHESLRERKTVDFLVANAKFEETTS